MEACLFTHRREMKEGMLGNRETESGVRGSSLSTVAEDVAAFARMEGLTGHARSAVIRFEGEQK